MSITLSKRGSVTVGRDSQSRGRERSEGERGGGGGVERELKFHLKHWHVELLHCHCQTLWCYSFTLHLSSCPTCNIERSRCHGESFVSEPKLSVIPVKLTLCKVSREMLSSGFSIFAFSLEGGTGKRELGKRFLHSFSSFFYGTLCYC